MFARLLTLLCVCVLGTSTSHAQKLFIGLDADMSSVAKQGGLSIQRGAEIAIDEINATGGVLGHELELIVKDHRGNPARGIKNINDFGVMEEVVAVLGGVHTPVILQELPHIHKHKLPFLVPWAAGTPITSNDFTPNYMFRVSIRDAEAGPVLVKYAQEREAASISLLLERTGWGRSNEVSMVNAARELGINVLGSHWVNWGEKNMSNQIQALELENPDAIMLVSNAPEGIVASQSILESKVLKNKPLIAHWGIAGGAFVEGIGLDSLSQLDISTIQTFSFINAHNNDKAQTVFEAYAKKYVKEEQPHSVKAVVGLAQAYDLVHMLALAIKQAESFDRSTIRQGLEQIDTYEGLIKVYEKPFSESQRDALLRDDYFIAGFDEEGNIVPK